MKKMIRSLSILALFLFGGSLCQAAAPVNPNKYRSTLLDRFVSYVQIDSQSQFGQFYGDWIMTPEVADAGEKLFVELKAILDKTQAKASIHFSEDKYVYVQFPSNLPAELAAQVPVLGLSAHYDVTPEVPGKGIKPRVIKNYQGGKIVINKEQNIVLDPQDTDKYLNSLIGETIVTSDGTTLLGADDKAGTSIVATVVQTLAENPTIPHGMVQIMLAPNEDVGLAAHRVDTQYFKPEIYYDFDGEVNGEVMAESFTAKGFRVTLRGISAHPSEAKAQGGVEGSEVLAAFLQHINQATDLKPNQSEGREPYIRFPAGQMKITGETIVLEGYARFFTEEEWDRMKKLVMSTISHLNLAYGTQNEVFVDETCQYKNLADGMHPLTKSIAEKAVLDSGVKPRFITVRGGITPGMMNARHGITGMGLFSGQQRPHSVYEWLSEKDMFQAYKTALNLIQQTVEQSLKKQKTQEKIKAGIRAATK